MKKKKFKLFLQEKFLIFNSIILLSLLNFDVQQQLPQQQPQQVLQYYFILNVIVMILNITIDEPVLNDFHFKFPSIIVITTIKLIKFFQNIFFNTKNLYIILNFTFLYSRNKLFFCHWRWSLNIFSLINLLFDLLLMLLILFLTICVLIVIVFQMYLLIILLLIMMIICNFFMII